MNVPDDFISRGAQRLCRKYGTLFIADEIQTGLGRTGRFFAVEHWGVEPDMVLIAKALSGGHVPVGAVLLRKQIFDKVFNRMDRAVVHGSTFAKNDLAMAAGLATLEVIESERLVENAAARRRAAAGELRRRWRSAMSWSRTVRGKGLMIGIEFGAPQIAQAESRLGAARDGEHGAVLPAHHHSPVQGAQDPRSGRRARKPHGQAAAGARHRPTDCDWIESAFDAVIAESHRVPGAVWSLGKTLLEGARSAARVG